MKRQYIKPETETVVVNIESLLDSTSKVLPIDNEHTIYEDSKVGAKTGSMWDEDGDY